MVYKDRECLIGPLEMDGEENGALRYALDSDLGEKYYKGERRLEEQITEETIGIIREFIAKRFRQGRRPALRDGHAEATGCVSAVFQVDDDLRERAPDLMRGVFNNPGERYRTWIRFSNGNCERQSARWPDPRGMAIKLLGVEGERLLYDEKRTQDFILVNRPVFFGDDLERYNEALRQYLSGGTISQYLSLTKLNWREKMVALRLNLNLITNPLFSQYWSMTPYRLGVMPGKRIAVKYTAIPTIRDSSSAFRRTLKFLSPGFSLRSEIDNVLLSREATFDFCIQRYVDNERTPIEDCKKEWRENYTPPVRVAQIIISPQSVTSTVRDAFCENLSFNPWHGISAHKPLGAVNRIRRKVYLETSNCRHLLNSVRPGEPS
jgi:hypothetical protein